jgi:myo-inositol catabolism protein IolS
MEMSPLGRSPLAVSRLCIGTWQAAGWSTSNDATFASVVHAALDRGINFFDTAPAYGDGHAERLLGAAIGTRRHEVILATKFHHTASRPDQIEGALTQSLKNLRCDYIDLYQQHWPPRNPPLEETLGALERLREKGLIRAIGVSNWMEPEWQEIAEPSRIDSLQPCYSLLWRSVEREVLPLMRRHGIGVIAYSPLAQGILAGTVTPDNVPTDFRAKNRLLRPILFPRVAAVLGELRSIAAELNRTLSQVALRWLLDTPGVSATIVGSSNLTQLEENLGALNWHLSSEHYDRLAAISTPVSADLAPHDTLWGWHPRGGGGKGPKRS